MSRYDSGGRGWIVPIFHRPNPHEGQPVGHITGTPPPDPPKADGISIWPWPR